MQYSVKDSSFDVNDDWMVDSGSLSALVSRLALEGWPTNSNIVKFWCEIQTNSTPRLCMVDF